jgi:hypothetical protein
MRIHLLSLADMEEAKNLEGFRWFPLAELQQKNWHSQFVSWRFYKLENCAILAGRVGEVNLFTIPESSRYNGIRPSTEADQVDDLNLFRCFFVPLYQAL